MKSDYIVVRIENATVTKGGDLTGDEPGVVAVSTNDDGINPDDVIVEAAEISEDEATKLNGSNDVALVAPALPLKLHDPVRDATVTGADVGKGLWGIQAVRADTSPFDGSGICVAVLDTGIAKDHPVFSGIKDRITEKDFTGEGNGDENGHGTHVAGTVFGQDVSGMRVGVARNPDSVLIGKVLNKKGGGSMEGMYKGLVWAITNKAHIVSMSLGVDFPGWVDTLVNKRGMTVRAAATQAMGQFRQTVHAFNTLAQLSSAIGVAGQDTLIIAASGNESDQLRDGGARMDASPPATAHGILAVGALASTAGQFSVAAFSNTKVDVCGPGVGVVSASKDGGFKSLDGTSMATPHVAGVATLWAEQLMTAQGSAQGLRATLIASASNQNISSPNVDDNGSGMVQAPQS